MRIYIAGKVTGLNAEATFLKFHTAEKEIKKQFKHYQIVNPVKIVNNVDAEWRAAMLMCLNELFTCDKIYFLQDWRESKGACIEFEVAKQLDIQMFFQGSNKH